jgi:phosphoenolpyruvate carboxykinase (GTP)
MGWLERLIHNEVTPIVTPIGLIPKYDDLKKLFAELVDKDYELELYNKQFSLYIDNIIKRIDLQYEAFKAEANVPDLCFRIYDEQKQGLLALKEKYGSIATPDQLEGEAG